MDVGSWLRSLGLERYEVAFRQNDIAWSLVPGLTAEDLREIGVASLGHRKQLVAAITALRRTEKADEAAASGPERRYLTVMFVDLVGSTPLSTELDPEVSNDIRNWTLCATENWTPHGFRILRAS